MTNRLAPWPLAQLIWAIQRRSLGAQSEQFDHRIIKLHERLTGIRRGENELMPDGWYGFYDATNPMDAVAAWFMLLLLNDPDWGMKPRTNDQQDLAAIQNATSLLRRWIEGDPTDTVEWRRLLPNPNQPDERGSLSSAGYAAAGLGRAFLKMDVDAVLDAAANAYFGIPIPKQLSKPFPVSLGSRIFHVVMPTLFFPLVLWRRHRFIPPIPVHRDYYPVLRRSLVQLMQLRWKPTTPEEARLFSQVVGRPELDRLPEYLDCLRSLHVEPEEIADAKEMLTRMSKVARDVGLQLLDHDYVTGMPSQRLFKPNAVPPPNQAAFREFRYVYQDDRLNWQYHIKLTNQRLVINDEFQTPKSITALKQMEQRYDELISTGNLEWNQSVSRRVFFRESPQPEYWTIEIFWEGNAESSVNRPETEEELDRMVFRVLVRTGPWPSDGTLWDTPAHQHRRWTEFPSRSTALAWYRREIERQLAAGFVESLPRLTYCSMKSRPVPVIEGKVIFDTEHPIDTPDESWMKSHSKPAFHPVVDLEETSPDTSKTSGTILVPHGTEWPICPACQHPKSLILQLNLSQLPDDVATRSMSRLLQVFECTNRRHCRGQRGPFSETQIGRLVELEQPTTTLDDPKSHPSCSITSWKRVTDYPCYNDFYEQGYFDLDLPYLTGEDREATLSAKYRCYTGEKLGGWPRIHPEDLNCQKCSQQMQVIYQFDCPEPESSDSPIFPRRVIVQCPHHPEVIALFEE